MNGTHLINRERVRCWRFGTAARREEGEYPLWIFDRRATLLQRQRSATLRAKLWQAAGGVAPQSQSSHWLCSFVAPFHPPPTAFRTHSLLLHWVSASCTAPPNPTRS